MTRKPQLTDLLGKPLADRVERKINRLVEREVVDKYRRQLHQRTVQLLTERVLIEVSRYFGITPQGILSHHRHGHLVKPRQLAMYLLHMFGYSTPVIGQAMDRDHSTVLHAIKVIKASPGIYRADLEALKLRMKEQT